MSIARRVRAAAIVVTVLATVSCATTHAPSGFLEEPEDLPTTAYGAWIEVHLRGEDDDGRVEGEFIAAGSESVYVLTRSGFEVVPKTDIRNARLEVHRSQTGSAAGLTALGTVASLSHGLGFAISGPLWILVGSIAAGAVSHEPLRQVPQRSWEDVKIFARFPQGIPPGLDRAALRHKPSGTTW